MKYDKLLLDAGVLAKDISIELANFSADKGISKFTGKPKSAKLAELIDLSLPPQGGAVLRKILQFLWLATWPGTEALKSIQICFFLAILAFSSKSAATTYDEIRKKEVEDFLSLIEGEQNNTYFIDVFGGLFPLPTRYIISYDDRQEGLHFSSNFRHGMGDTPLSDLYRPFGLIVIDKVKKCDICTKSKIADNRLILKYEEFEEITFLKAQIKQEPRKAFYYIYDENTYMSIVDENSDTWPIAFEVLKKTIIGRRNSF